MNDEIYNKINLDLSTFPGSQFYTVILDKVSDRSETSIATEKFSKKNLVW